MGLPCALLQRRRRSVRREAQLPHRVRPQHKRFALKGARGRHGPPSDRPTASIPVWRFVRCAPPPGTSEGSYSGSLSSRALIATITVLADINTAPIAGLRMTPMPARTPAASGMANTL